MRIPLLLSILLITLTAACQRPAATATTTDQATPSATETIAALAEQRYQPPTTAGTVERIEKSEEEWKAQLTDAEYYVLRQAGTERAGTGDLLQNKEDGIYTCAACGLPLFDSGTKFESGTGWPSFYQPIDGAYVTDYADNSFGMRRVENRCGRCDSHLGHVFEDGPPPTGLRYCMNSLALDFVPRSVTEKSED